MRPGVPAEAQDGHAAPDVGPDAAGTVPDEDRAAPVLVLGCHRSGTSAVTGLLAVAGGLHLGDLMPATAANPTGYFEAVSVVKAHNDILASLDRDWTCPPQWMDINDIPMDGLAHAISQLAEPGVPWGVKDPRLLFMLPAWAELMDSVRLVGVVREHEETVRSIVARDGIDPWVANEIVRTHLQRLRVLADEFDFPVIDFSKPSESVIETVAKVAGDLGLEWDPEAAGTFLNPELATRRSRGRVDNPDEADLRRPARALAEPKPIDGTRLRATLASLAPPVDELDRYSGPRAVGRRARLWTVLPNLQAPAIEFTRNLKVASKSRVVPENARVVECRDLLTIHQTLRSRGDGVEAVVLPDVTSWITSGDMPGLFGLLQENLPDGAAVVVGISRADRDTRYVMRWPAIELSDVCDAAQAAGMVVLSRRDDPLLSSVLLLVRATTDKLLRQLLTQGGSTPVTSTLLPEKRVRTKARAAKAISENEVWHRRHDRLRNRRSVRVALRLAGLAKPFYDRRRGGEEESAATAVEAPPGDGPPAAAAASAGSATTGAKPEIDWEARYHRLRNRRVVRAALAISSLARPAFRLARRGGQTNGQ